MARFVFWLSVLVLACLLSILLTGAGGATPACPSGPNPPARCRVTPTPTPTSGPSPSPTETPTPSPTPVPGTNDVTMAYDVTVGNHVQAWFGAYQPSVCEDAVIFMAASGLEPAPTTYDLLIAASDDGVTPRNNQWQNIGNSSPGGANGTWT